MMEWTTRDYRVLARTLSRRARLYTEMVTTGALLHGDRPRHLDFDPLERPLALQLGGSEPDALARCAELAEAWGYDEVNLNVGCPSERVQKGAFGACLLAEPETVAAGVAAMGGACGLPVTVKTRIGVDHRDSYDELAAFVERVAAAGCGVFLVHARKAWLQGLSPRENRTVPPLDYPRVYRLKADFPELTIVLNGGVQTLADAAGHLGHVDGVMLGRVAYHTPYLLANVDRALFGDDAPPPGRAEAVRRLEPYVARRLAAGVPLHRVARHLLGLFHGVPRGKRWRRRLSEDMHRPDAGLEVLEAALAEVEAAGARRTEAPQTGSAKEE
jgi:tRNA-dihydrouridine synthase A